MFSLCCVSLGYFIYLNWYVADYCRELITHFYLWILASYQFSTWDCPASKNFGLKSSSRVYWNFLLFSFSNQSTRIHMMPRDSRKFYKEAYRTLSLLDYFNVIIIKWKHLLSRETLYKKMEVLPIHSTFYVTIQYSGEQTWWKQNDSNYSSFQQYSIQGYTVWNTESQIVYISLRHQISVLLTEMTPRLWPQIWLLVWLQHNRWTACQCPHITEYPSLNCVWLIMCTAYPQLPQPWRTALFLLWTLIDSHTCIWYGTVFSCSLSLYSPKLS